MSAAQGVQNRATRSKKTGALCWPKVGTREGFEVVMAAIVPLTAAVDLAQQTIRCECV